MAGLGIEEGARVGFRYSGIPLNKIGLSRIPFFFKPSEYRQSGEKLLLLHIGS